MNKQQQQQQAFGHGDVPASAAGGGYCCFHPREVVVGVCAHCLKDRLLLLLAAAAANSNNADATDAVVRRRSRSSSISLPKVFALGSSFLQRLDSRHHRGRDRDRDRDRHPDNNNNCYSDDDDDLDADDAASVASLDGTDSFISIKFEDNGKATWDSSQSQQHKQAQTAENKAAPARSSSSSTVVVAVENVMKRGGVTRWRKQVVGRLLQLARWRTRSSNSKAGGAAASHCHVGGMDGKHKSAAERSRGARAGRGWIRSLTRRRAHGDRAW